MKNQNKSNRFNIETLKLLIENSTNDKVRLECLELINLLDLKDPKSFEFFERLLISDSNQTIRRLSFEILINIYPSKAIKPVIYAISNENGPFLVSMIEFLSKIDPSRCKSALIKKILQTQTQELKDKLEPFKLHKFDVAKLKEIVYNHQLNQSLEALYFHRRSMPLALDFYGID